MAAPPGAVISNRATLAFRDFADQPVTVPSNIVEVTTAVLRSPASVEFTRIVPGGVGSWQETVGPSACSQGGAFAPLADPRLLGGAVIDPTQVQASSATGAFNLGETIFIRLVDQDQNLDYQLIDTATVTVTSPSNGDSETIRLSETGYDTGVFAGFVPSGGAAALAGDCVLQGTSKSILHVAYTDPADSTDVAGADAVFDPAQRVFESRTGTLVSGATIEIVNAGDGLPATVYGNDGVSQFPSAIVSGGSAVDGSGTSYVFGPGEYRFPVVPDGNYRLIVTPPPDYSAPSAANSDDLQNLPGAPFLLGAASFGASFTKSGDVSVAFDIPLDPRAESLFLQKRAMAAAAAPGDFVRFELDLQNASVSGIATDVTIVDRLPPGMRFVPESVAVDGSSAPDPVVSVPGALEFDIGRLDTGERVTISYVVEILAGKQGRELVNRATAFAGGGLLSNEALAMIRLTEDLFRSTGTIIGRVLEGDCSQDGFGEDQGVENIRIYLEDGRYAVSDAGGRFHFEGLRAGTHVAQLDTFSLPDHFDVIGCSDTPGFAGRADSQFVDLTRGALLRADFYLRRKPAPQGRIDLELRSKGTDSADEVAYDLTINGVGNVPVENIEVTVTLPAGVSYVAGSMNAAGAEAVNPRVNGQALSLALADRDNNWTAEIEFLGAIGSQVSGELATTATATFDSPIASNQRTPVAETLMIREPGVVENAGYVLDLKFDVLSDELSVQDKIKLDRVIEKWRGVRDIQVSAVGHSDSQRIAPRNRHLFADNYALSRARATSAAAYIASALGLDVGDLQIAGRGPDEPVADNTTAAGRARNRRVELVMSGIRPSRPSFVEVTKASSGTQAVETRGAIPGTERQPAYEADEDNAALQSEPPIQTLRPGIAMLLPARGFAPAIPATRVSIQHEASQTVAVWVNGRRVNSVNFDTTEYNDRKTVAISRWRGVALDDGANEILAVVKNADGSTARTLERNIHFSGQPIRAEIVIDESVLVADGKTRPVVAVRLYDSAGQPARRGMVGTFRIDSPYRSWWDVENDRTNDLVQVASREPTYRIGHDGIARIELEPTTQSGELTLHLKFENAREQQLRAWMKPEQRDWILVGFAEGTAAFNTLSENVIAAEQAGVEEGYYDDGRVAFFAKGRIKGEYLLTLAYDSDRERSETEAGFAGVVDPDRFYTLYADNSEQRFEASSQRKLYVKLERSQFFALFGDFETGLAITDLSRYQRRFNGLHSEYRGEHLGFTAFAAETRQSFNRDELRGDGTSGLYRLSRSPIVAYSERVRIEIRDRFDSGRVLETTNLSQFVDYHLDALDGTLYFKKPIPSRDLNFNPVFVVVEYESLSAGEEDLIAGGRVSLRTSSGDVEVGATRIVDNTEGAGSDLTGVDLRWQLGEQTILKAEAANSRSTVAGLDRRGSAQSVELEHNSGILDLRAFAREVDDDFGMGYQSTADRGVRRLGIDARMQVGDRWYAEGEAGWQQILKTRDVRRLARGQLRYQHDEFTAMAGLVHAQDEFADGETRASNVVEIGITQRILDGKVNLRAGGSAVIGDDAQNADVPTSFLLGADYRLMDGIDLVAEYEEAEGRDISATMTRLGVRASPWARSQINTGLTNEVTEFGPRLFANVGLVQGFQLNERWLLDIGLDQTNTLVDSGARLFDPDRELASGSLNDDFLAVYGGAMYSADVWSANTRIEHRNSDSEERVSVLFGWYRQPGAGHGLSAGLTLFRAETDAGTRMTAADFRFGWAHRPAYGAWSFLNRLDLKFDEFDGAARQEKSWRVINNFNANHRFSAATQMSLQYAFKYVRSAFASRDFSGYTDLIGFDLRRGLRPRWDVGASASIYHSYRSEVMDYGAGIDVGYTLATNVRVSLGYNLAGFDDADFRAARYTAQGPFLRFSIKADQHTLKDIAGLR